MACYEGGVATNAPLFFNLQLIKHMSEESTYYEKGEFYRVAERSMPNLASLLPDGMDKPWHRRWLGKLKMVWNFIKRQAVYEAEPVFQGIFGKSKTLGDISTPVAATVFIPDTEQTVTFLNKKTDFINEELMPHDLFVERPDVRLWQVTGYSSCIPYVFSLKRKNYVHPRISEGSPYAAQNVSTVYGFVPVDGAVSAYYGAMGASVNENKIIVTVFPTKRAKPLDYSSGMRIASWWGVGSTYALLSSAMYMLNNEGADKLALAKQLGAVELGCDAYAARDELLDSTGEEFPNGAQFARYTVDVMLEIFNYQYDKIRKMVEESPIYDLDKYAREGMVICVSSGGAFAVDELAGICALCDAVSARAEEGRDGIINLITGTSAGSLNAVFVAQIHDEVYNLNGEE